MALYIPLPLPTNVDSGDRGGMSSVDESTRCVELVGTLSLGILCCLADVGFHTSRMDIVFYCSEGLQINLPPTPSFANSSQAPSLNTYYLFQFNTPIN